MPKIRIGVLMGGKSIEREVSFNSGRTVCDHIDTQLFNVIPLFQTVDNRLFILPWRFLYRGKISDFLHRLTDEAEEIIWDDLASIVDIMFIAMHGRFAEDGSIQGFLDILGVPYIGTGIFGSALSMNKAIQKTFLKTYNIKTPIDMVVQPYQLHKNNMSDILQRMQKNNLNFPCIVKPVHEGSSLGIRLVKHERYLYDALVYAATIDPGKKQLVLIEEKIEGMEFTCIVLTDVKTGEPFALPPTEIVLEKGANVFDYEQKYMPGKSLKFTPARCDKKGIQKIQDVCLRVKKALNMSNLARIDGFLTKQGDVVIIDPNSFSGMAPSSFFFKQAAEIGMSHTDVINHIIKTDIQRYNLVGITEQKNKKGRAVKKKMRIVVLFGGRSHEKEISLESGRNIVYKLSPHVYDVIPVFVNKDMQLYKINNRLLVCNKTSEVVKGLTESMRVSWHELPALCDFVFIGLHGGDGENGAVQGTLEMLGLSYNGSGVLTSALCIDKSKTAQFLQSKGFDVPKQTILAQEEWQKDKKVWAKKIVQTYTFPLIVKPHDDGCSVFVKKVDNEHDLLGVIDEFFMLDKKYMLVEEYINGMELTVGVLGNESPRALPPSYSISTKGFLSMEEKFLPGQGENQTPAPLTKQAQQFVQKAIERIYKAAQCKGYARIDCFYQSPEQSADKKERLVILEINTLPALTPATCIFHQAAEIGMKPMEFIDAIVTYGMQEHNTLVCKPDKAIQKESV